MEIPDEQGSSGSDEVGKEMHFTFKEDTYSTSRGKYSRILDIYCRKCKNHICYYQKDGGTKKYMGQLRRLYIDRFFDNKPQVSTGKELICKRCKESLGTEINYKKEDRKAFRLYVGAVTKKIIKIRKNK